MVRRLISQDNKQERTSMGSSAKQFDVIIVGAGVVGSALACALGGSDLKVAVIEGRPLSSDWPEQNDTVDGFDCRVSALTLASQQFLQSLEVWPLLAEQRLSPYQHMHVWDAEGTGSIDFHADEIHQPALGHIVENNITMAALLQVLQQQPNVELFSGLKLQSMTAVEALAAGNEHAITLADGRQLQAKLVVAADGGQSIVRQLAGFTLRQWDYGHQAIVCTVACEAGHQQTAWQRFLPAGPLAFLPLATAAGGQQFCSIVWSTLPEYAERLMAMDDKAFALELQQAFESKLGEVQAVSRRFAFPLRQCHAADYIKPGLVLVGDAAHAIHPLAGQGVNLGLMDVQVLAEELLRAQQRQLDIGSELVLARYQRRRKPENLAMMAAMDGFKRLFEQPSLPLRWLRNTGMRWLDNAGPLKRRIMRQAMGL
jgi:2-octaprenylphenol hydroxylase